MVNFDLSQNITHIVPRLSVETIVGRVGIDNYYHMGRCRKIQEKRIRQTKAFMLTTFFVALVLITIAYVCNHLFDVTSLEHKLMEVMIIIMIPFSFALTDFSVNNQTMYYKCRNYLL